MDVEAHGVEHYGVVDCGRWMVRGGFLTGVGRTMKHDHRLGGKEGSRVEDGDARVEVVLHRCGGREWRGHSKEVK